MMKQWQNLRALFGRADGAITVELALLAPILATMFMGMADVSMGIARQLTLEGAAQRAVEKAIAYGNAGSNYADLRRDAAAAAGVDVWDVTMEKWLECGGVLQDNFTNVCDTTTQISRHIKITVRDVYVPVFPYGPLGHMIGANDAGNIPIAASAEVRIQ